MEEFDAGYLKSLYFFVIEDDCIVEPIILTLEYQASLYWNNHVAFSFETRASLALESITLDDKLIDFNNCSYRDLEYGKKRKKW
jgi:hypothetical protein